MGHVAAIWKYLVGTFPIDIDENITVKWAVCIFITLSIGISLDGKGDKRGRHYDSKFIFLGKMGIFNAIFSSMSMGI